MQGRFQKTVFVLVGLVLLWCTTSVFQGVAREGSDRGNAVQVPLLVLVLGAPALSYLLRRRHVWVPVSLLVAQFVLYILYETGVSIETNIRADVLLIYPAILLNAWIARRAAAFEADGKGSSDSTSESVPLDRTECDACGTVYPSHYYLRAAGSRGYICIECGKKS